MKPLKWVTSFFNQYRKLHTDGGFSAAGAMLRAVQSAYYWVFRNDEFDDMMRFDFIKFKHPDIYETMFTRKDNAELLPLINAEDQLPILREKHRLLERLDGVGRRFLYIPDHTPEEVLTFLDSDREMSYALKVDNGAFGKGMSFLKAEGKNFIRRYADDGTTQVIERDDFPALYQELAQNHILIEEYICQHSAMAAFFPGCVNTVHLYTFLLPDGTAEIAGRSFAIFGMADSLISNGSNSVRVMIKPDGTLYDYGFAEGVGIDPYPHIRKVDAHPGTGVPFPGFKIPFWDEVKALVKQSAEKVPELRFARWDVAVTETGPVVVEGNGMPDSFTLDQTYSLEANGIGVKREYSELLKTFIFSKRLTPEYIEKINRYLTEIDSHRAAGDCDAVVILGSAKCSLRTQAALDAFGENPDIRYIVCGGVASVHPKDPEHPEKGMYTEAEYMKRYLMERNVREDRILVDNESVDTKGNLINAAALLRQCGAKSAAVVTSWFHCRRTMEMLPKIEGVEIPLEKICTIPSVGSQVKPDNWYKSLYGIRAIYHEVQDSGLV